MMSDAERPETLELSWLEGDMPYSQAFGDQFYCREDGRAECGHVFLSGNGLPKRWQLGGEFVIGELGFGTGLNFCETWRSWTTSDPKARLHFISFERYPMDSGSIEKALARWPEIETERKRLAARWPTCPSGVIDLDLADDVRLTVICGDALSNLLASDQTFDAWFLDGFSPSRNPDMWSERLMKSVFDHTKPEGSFATYAAAGFVRRNLISAGFQVERRPGFGGKREMLCGVKPLVAS
jgi:tRNA U34 5-methylaminomethyl-2-thiouridine-forming methyltransferase MnmC